MLAIQDLIHIYFQVQEVAVLGDAVLAELLLVQQALAAFYWIRELRGIEKKPSTSELVDWLRALVAGGVDPERLEKEIPFAGVLLKKDKDLRALQRARR